MTAFWCRGKNGLCHDNDKCKERGCEFFNGDGGYSMEIKTNADRIRAMSDEELAEFVQYGSCPYIEGDCTMKGCVECILDWLKQPVKDGEDDVR